ncbi:MAG: reverse transcriptase domain-containing protein, partial [Pseudomonadota bacterium]
MKLEESLERAISEEAEKLCLRHHAYHNAIAIENNRKSARSKTPRLLRTQRPAHWSLDKKFDPFYVKKNSNAIARSIARKIAAGTWRPNPPKTAPIPKKGGGQRAVSIYQIPDAAVSTLFYKRLLAKNRHRFSSFSYAYRNDRNVHFAIQDISIELLEAPRLFVAEIDFTKFFDSISHEFLLAQFDSNGFFISPEERTVIGAFLPNTGVGVPQGTSVSLFLANLACWSLDKGFEREGLQFARYADDTIIWSRDYAKIGRAFDLLHEFSSKSGVDINYEKSAGISLLCDDSVPSEFAARKSHVEFLGYAISSKTVSIKADSVLKIKRQISYILYKQLLQPLMSSPLRAVVIPANNRDAALLSAIAEIRRYLYGNLDERMLNSYLRGRSNHIFFRGIMSFYPIINDVEQMKRLDGWLVDAIFKAVRKREKLLAKHQMPRGYMRHFKASRRDLLEYCRETDVGGQKALRI